MVVERGKDLTRRRNTCRSALSMDDLSSSSCRTTRRKICQQYGRERTVAALEREAPGRGSSRKDSLRYMDGPRKAYYRNCYVNACIANMFGMAKSQTGPVHDSITRMWYGCRFPTSRIAGLSPMDDGCYAILLLK